MTRDICSQLQWWAENCDRCNGGCQVRGLLKDAAQEIYVLRAQQEAEQNEPLTLDELREMLGRWVWVVVQCEHCECQGWAFVSTGYLAFLEQKIPFGSYGNKAIAYRRKPEEVLS